MQVSKKWSTILLSAVLLTPIPCSYVVYFYLSVFPSQQSPICDFFHNSFSPHINPEHSPTLNWPAFWNSCLFDLWLHYILCRPFLMKFRVFTPYTLLSAPHALSANSFGCSVVFCCLSISASAVGSSGLPASQQPAPCCLATLNSLCSCFSLLSNRGKGNVAKMTSLIEFCFLLIWLFPWAGSCGHFYSSSVLMSISIDFTGLLYSMLTGKLFFAHQTHTKPMFSVFVYWWISLILNITENYIYVFSVAYIIHAWVNCFKLKHHKKILRIALGIFIFFHFCRK